ncbi:hypothetical protein ACTHGU_20140 [Chitinophagaceae bacterium MMS25-I14]
MKRPKLIESTDYKDMRLLVPAHFTMLCELLDVTPEHVLSVFMSTVSSDHYLAAPPSKDSAISYFVRCDYGSPHFSRAIVQRMLDELAAINYLFPAAGNPKQVDEYVKWRTSYRRYWLEIWTKRKGQLKAAQGEENGE